MSRSRLATASLLVSLALLLMLTACAAKTDDSAKLSANAWKVASLGGTAVTPAAPLTAEFSAGKISGSTGINRFSGSYTTQPGNLISIQPGPMTLAAGSPQAMALQTAYVKALTDAKAYTVDDSKLTLSDSAGTALVTFDVYTPLALVGTNWTCIAYNNGRGGLQGTLATSTITAKFGEDGTLTGNGGVNTYNTTFKTSGSSVTIDAAIATTRMAGPADVMAQEEAYLAALPRATTFTIEGNELWLRDASGAAQAQYTGK